MQAPNRVRVLKAGTWLTVPYIDLDGGKVSFHDETALFALILLEHFAMFDYDIGAVLLVFDGVYFFSSGRIPPALHQG